MATLILFDYTNHRGDEHKYLARIGRNSLVFGRVFANDEQNVWLLDTEVLQRDGVDRPGFRHFKLTEIRNLEEVDDAEGG